MEPISPFLMDNIDNMLANKDCMLCNACVQGNKDYVLRWDASGESPEEHPRRVGKGQETDP